MKFHLFIAYLTVVNLLFTSITVIAQTLPFPSQCDILAFDIFPSLNLADATIFTMPINLQQQTYVLPQNAPTFDSATTYYYMPTFRYGDGANFTLTLFPLTAFSSDGSHPPDIRRAVSGLAACGTQLQLNVHATSYYDFNSTVSCNYNYRFPVAEGCSIGDPQFQGLQGQSFQVHGIDGAVYNLISAPTYSVNSKFIFLDDTSKSCPIMPSTGKKSIACWSHPGSYLSNLAIVTAFNEYLLIESGNHIEGFKTITINEKPLNIGETHYFTNKLGFISYNNTHEVTIEIGAFSMYIENNNHFINLAKAKVIKYEQLSEGEGIHGLIGQTWRNRRYKGQKIEEIEGNVDDYVINEDNNFGTEFVFSRFEHATK